MEISDNLMICHLSIDINKFPITMSCLTYDTCGPTMRTCGVSFMRHAVVKGLIFSSEVKLLLTHQHNFNN